MKGLVNSDRLLSKKKKKKKKKQSYFKSVNYSCKSFGPDCVCTDGYNIFVKIQLDNSPWQQWKMASL